MSNPPTDSNAMNGDARSPGVDVDRPERLLPMRAVRDQVALHPATVYAMVRAGEFPKPIKMGRRSLWVESEVQAWIAARIADARMGQSMGQKSAA